MEPSEAGFVEVNGIVIAERRAVPRQRVFKGAVVGFNKGYGVLECVVRNICDRGALLRFGDATGVPGNFDLQISGEMQIRPAHVRWRKGHDVGIAFYSDGLPPVAW